MPHHKRSSRGRCRRCTNDAKIYLFIGNEIRVGVLWSLSSHAVHTYAAHGQALGAVCPTTTCGLRCASLDSSDWRQQEATMTRTTNNKK